MSVWQSVRITPSVQQLLCAAVTVDPRRLEDLLETLAKSQHPINPQIYHDALLRYRFADGREQTERATLVEFPAYGEWLAPIRSLLAAGGFSPDSLHVAGMLEELRSDTLTADAPAGAAWRTVTIRKCPPAAVAAVH